MSQGIHLSVHSFITYRTFIEPSYALVPGAMPGSMGHKVDETQSLPLSSSKPSGQQAQKHLLKLSQFSVSSDKSRAYV